MRLPKIIAMSFHYLYTLFKLTKSLFGVCFLIVFILIFKYKKIKQAIYQLESILMFSLSKAQIHAFKALIEDKRFSEEFSIPPIRDAGLIILDSQDNFYKEENKKIIIGSSAVSFFILFLLLILNTKLQKIIKNTFAERVNMVATKGKLSVFVTNTFLGKDPFDFANLRSRKFTIHCAHYSENSVGIGIGKVLDYPFSHRWLGKETSDYHWVWSEGYATYIRKVNPRANVKVVGFVSFEHLPEKHNFKVTVFNITPFTLDSSVNPLNQVDNCFKFILDILKITKIINQNNNTIKITIHIKPKREYRKTHSIKYINFLQDLENQNKLILEHHSINPYKLVSNSNLVISTPFTTAAQVGKNMGIPSVYYNHLNEDIHYPIKTSIRLLQNYQELFDYVDKLVYKKILNINRVKIY